VDEPTTDVIQGTLDMLILKTLSLEPMHGFGISRRIEQVSRGARQMTLSARNRRYQGRSVASCKAEAAGTQNARKPVSRLRAQINRLPCVCHLVVRLSSPSQIGQSEHHG